MKFFFPSLNRPLTTFEQHEEPRRVLSEFGTLLRASRRDSECDDASLLLHKFVHQRDDPAVGEVTFRNLVDIVCFWDLFMIKTQLSCSFPPLFRMFCELFVQVNELATEGPLYRVRSQPETSSVEVEVLESLIAEAIAEQQADEIIEAIENQLEVRRICFLTATSR